MVKPIAGRVRDRDFWVDSSRTEQPASFDGTPWLLARPKRPKGPPRGMTIALTLTANYYDLSNMHHNRLISTHPFVR